MTKINKELYETLTRKFETDIATKIPEIEFSITKEDGYTSKKYVMHEYSLHWTRFTHLANEIVKELDLNGIFTKARSETKLKPLHDKINAIDLSQVLNHAGRFRGIFD